MCELFEIEEEYVKSSFFNQYKSLYENFMYLEFSNKVITIDTGKWQWINIKLDNEELPILIYTVSEKVILKSQYNHEETSSFVASLCISLLVLNKIIWELQDVEYQNTINLDSLFFRLKNWIFHNSNSYLSQKDKRIIYSFID